MRFQIVDKCIAVCDLFLVPARMCSVVSHVVYSELNRQGCNSWYNQNTVFITGLCPAVSCSSIHGKVILVSPHPTSLKCSYVQSLHCL